MACQFKKSETFYDVTVGGHNVSSTEQHENYNKTKDAAESSDRFPCGHVICHQCLRRNLDIKSSKWTCPVCGQEFVANAIHASPNNVMITDNLSNSSDKDVISIMSNFDGMVAKFQDINRTIDVLKHEQVRARSIGMCYSPVVCDNCDVDHSILRVVQEYNDLSVAPQRSSFLSPYLYYGRQRTRYVYDRVVTTYDSKVSSACVCVPCSYQEIQRDPAAFYALTENNNMPINDKSAGKIPLTEVAKLITKSPSPSKALKGKNVIEIEHKVKVTNKIGEFDFVEATEQIKRVVRQSETDLVQVAKKRIRDTGDLYHIKEQNAIDFDPSETVV